MPTVSGPLSVVTEGAAVVTAVWVQARELRPHGEGAILPQRARVTLGAGSTVTFPCAPGPAVLIWQVGSVEGHAPILVTDEPDQTLASVVRAARLSSGRTADELAALVAQVTEGVSAVTAAASSATWDGDRLTVMGATSPPLTGDKGDPGPPGDTPTIGENGTWWVDGVDTGVKAQGPAGSGTGDVLWSELNPILDGKAPVSHQHVMADITDLGEALDGKVPWTSVYPSPDGNTVAYRSSSGALAVGTATASDHAVTKAQLDAVDTRVDTRKGVIHSGTGPPPSSIPGAMVGDYWLNETSMELSKITGL